MWKIAGYLSPFDMYRLHATSFVLHRNLERELFTRVYNSKFTVRHEIPELDQYRVKYRWEDFDLPLPPVWSDITPFHLAAATGSTGAVRKYLDMCGIPIDSRCPGRRSTALLYATIGGHTATMKFLLGRGANINKGMLRGNPIKEGDISGPYPEWCDVDTPGGCLTPLRFAIEYANLASLKVLLDHGATLLDDMDLPKDCAEWEGREDEGGVLRPESCPIHVAVTHSGHDYPKDNLTEKRKGIVRELLACGAPVDYRDLYGWTALHHLCADDGPWKNHPLWPGPRYYDTPGMVWFLIKNGANINARSSSDSTPLHYAFHAHNLVLVKVLIEAGADINAAMEGGETPLHYASKADTHYASEADNLAITKLLIKAGADVNARNAEGETPLHRTSHAHNLEMTKALIEAGADVNAADELGVTPLLMIWSSHANHVEIASMLLEAGADPSARRKLWRSGDPMWDGDSPVLTLLDQISIEIYEYSHTENIHQQYKRRGGSETTSLCYYRYDHQPKECNQPNWVRDLGPIFSLLKVLLKYGAKTSWRHEKSIKDFRILLSLWGKNGVDCGAHLSGEDVAFSGPCDCNQQFPPIP